MTTIQLRVNQRQTQTLSPRLQQAVRLLQMSSLDFATLLKDTLGKNPFIDIDGDDARASARLDGAGRDPIDSLLERGASEGSHEGIGPVDSHADRSDGSCLAGNDISPDVVGDRVNSLGPGLDHDGASDRDLWQADIGADSGLHRQHGGQMLALDMMAVETPLNGHLHGQLSLLAPAPRDRVLAQTVIESLDDDGYLRTPLADLLAVPDLHPPATWRRWRPATSRAWPRA